MTASKPIKPAPISPDHTLSVFGRRVKEERTRQRITQEQLAEYAGVSDDTIKRIEKGDGVKLDVAFNVAVALSIPIQSLLPIQEENRTERIRAARLLLEELENMI